MRVPVTVYLDTRVAYVHADQCMLYLNHVVAIMVPEFVRPKVASLPDLNTYRRMLLRALFVSWQTWKSTPNLLRVNGKRGSAHCITTIMRTLKSEW